MTSMLELIFFLQLLRKVKDLRYIQERVWLAFEEAGLAMTSEGEKGSETGGVHGEQVHISDQDTSRAREESVKNVAAAEETVDVPKEDVQDIMKDDHKEKVRKENGEKNLVEEGEDKDQAKGSAKDVAAEERDSGEIEDSTEENC